jgi:multisubunit Na+/H+ antiporter MnhE subunit
MRRLAVAGLALALAAGFYLLLIDTISTPELYAGAGVVLLAGLAFTMSREQGLTEASIAPLWLLAGWRAVARVPRDVVVLCWTALRQLCVPSRSRGTFRAIPFKGGQAPRDVGRAALTEILGSLAPNTVVIGIDAERDLLLVHQLHPSGGRDELDVLRLG